MKQEDKELLLKDLCARLPYHPTIHIYNVTWEGCRIGEFDNTMWFHHVEAFLCDRIEIKPYLRPMSSMTDEERDEFRTVGGVMSHNVQNDTWAISAFAPEAYDWLNEHHFDYRIDPFTGKTLIESGLALKALEGMYKTE